MCYCIEREKKKQKQKEAALLMGAATLLWRVMNGRRLSYCRESRGNQHETII